jgi:hypothetical protein
MFNKGLDMDINLDELSEKQLQLYLHYCTDDELQTLIQERRSQCAKLLVAAQLELDNRLKSTG